jgi:hypothetical protein
VDRARQAPSGSGPGDQRERVDGSNSAAASVSASTLRFLAEQRPAAASCFANSIWRSQVGGSTAGASRSRIAERRIEEGVGKAAHAASIWSQGRAPPPPPRGAPRARLDLFDHRAEELLPEVVGRRRARSFGA